MYYKQLQLLPVQILRDHKRWVKCGWNGLRFDSIADIYKMHNKSHLELQLLVKLYHRMTQGTSGPEPLRGPTGAEEVFVCN